VPLRRVPLAESQMCSSTEAKGRSNQPVRISSPEIRAEQVSRMMYDIEVFRSYFQNLVGQLPELARLVDRALGVGGHP
jgi:hypothetical protein